MLRRTPVPVTHHDSMRGLPRREAIWCPQQPRDSSADPHQIAWAQTLLVDPGVRLQVPSRLERPHWGRKGDDRGIRAWIALGVIIAIIAEKLTGKRPGVLVAVVAGTVGAVVNGFLAKQPFHSARSSTPAPGVPAIVDAALLMHVRRAFRARGSAHR